MGGLGDKEEQSNAALMVYAPKMFKAIVGTIHALRSYQYGNDSHELALEGADFLEALIREITERGLTKC
jgi:hypothetical protein